MVIKKYLTLTKQRLVNRRTEGRRDQNTECRHLVTGQGGGGGGEEQSRRPGRRRPRLRQKLKFFQRGSEQPAGKDW